MTFATTRRISILLALSCLLILPVVARAADAPFEKEIKAFEELDHKNPPPKDAVLFIGSSSIRKWKSLGADFPDVVTINRGFGGSKIADSTRYVDRIVTPYHPKLIVMYAGDNDIAGHRTPQQVLEDFRTFVEKVRQSQPEVPILYISIKPSLARWKLVDKIKEANSLIEQYTREGKALGYIDIFPAMLGEDGKPRPELFVADGLHMTEAGYKIWTKIITPRIK
jgi:lysophospholipase L1-like esterase